jgi:dipeptidyl aminopeptidase/acylaminoacyl peptidase
MSSSRVRTRRRRRRTAHAWFYPPAGDGVRAPHGELPPLLVMVHGGPTAAADPSFRLSTQFWTSRGFAVTDVDYGGSTGYGRAYRRLLDDAWGIVDVQDACAAAGWLADQGLVDGDRLAIRGGSAGGFTALVALATTDVFAAGASHYGVADLGALARDTHKFESRYLDRLVGPWPQAEAIYRERSPLSHLEGFTAALIVLQGLQDEVVPPAQAELIVAGLRERGVPHAYLTFDGEQHGFRIAANIVRAITAELYFYSRVFGFTPAGELEPVQIAFAERLPAPGR